MDPPPKSPFPPLQTRLIRPKRLRSFGVTYSEVTPVVGPDGYTIDLNLTSQVVEFDVLISVGSPFTW